MLCGILVVVALLVLLGTAPSAYAADCRLQIIDHEDAVLKTFTVEAGESDCRREFGTKAGLERACKESDEAQEEVGAGVDYPLLLGWWCLPFTTLNVDPVSETNAAGASGETEANSLSGETVQFLLNNDITYDAGTKQLNILGAAVNLPRSPEVRAEDYLASDGTSLTTHYASAFAIDGDICEFHVFAKFELSKASDQVDTLRKFVAEAKPKETSQMLNCQDGSDKVVQLPVPWAQVANFFSQCKFNMRDGVADGSIELSAFCYNVVGVTEAGQFEDQLKKVRLFMDDGNFVYRVSYSGLEFGNAPPAMQGKAHQRQSHRLRHRGRHAHRANRGRARHANRARHGRYGR